MFELLTITENGKKKELPIRFGMNSLRLFTKATNKTLNDLQYLGSDMSLEDALQLIQAGLIDGHRKAGQEYIYSIEDIADFLDEDQSVLERAMKVFGDQYNTEPQGKESREVKPLKNKK